MSAYQKIASAREFGEKFGGYIEYAGNDPKELAWQKKYEKHVRKWEKEDMKKKPAREFGEKLAMDPRLMGGLGGAAVMGLGGAALGAMNPGEEETVDDNGRVVKRQKSRLSSALAGGLGGALAGGAGGAALGHFRGDNVRDFGNMLRARLGGETQAPPPKVI
jgi:hypothetical protein